MFPDQVLFALLNLPKLSKDETHCPWRVIKEHYDVSTFYIGKKGRKNTKLLRFRLYRDLYCSSPVGNNKETRSSYIQRTR